MLTRDFLRSASLFSALGDADADALVGLGREEAYKKGQAIFREGEPSGKLYLVKGALIEVRDTLTGRMLGDWAVPGLDESVAFLVSDGAGLLAEETRVSMFELPA